MFTSDSNIQLFVTFKGYLISSGSRLYEITVDGRLLVDQGIYLGDDHVEYQTNGGQGDIVSKSTPLTTPSC